MPNANLPLPSPRNTLATFTISPTPVPPGGRVTATWTGNSAPTAKDWVGWYKPGDPVGSGGTGPQDVQWNYTNVTVPDGSQSTQAPPLGGPYEMRFYQNDTYGLVATSNQFEVAEAPILPPPSSDPNAPSGLIEEPSEGIAQ